MNTYTAVRDRLLKLLEEKEMSIHKLATESGMPPLHRQEHSLRKEP